MADFPELSSMIVEWDSFEEDVLTDPTVRSQSPDGRPLARAGVQPDLMTFRFTGRNISATDKATLETFEHTTIGFGGDTFGWTDPRSGGSSYTVRFGSPIKWRPEPKIVNRYIAVVHLVEEPGY